MVFHVVLMGLSRLCPPPRHYLQTQADRLAESNIALQVQGPVTGPGRGKRPQRSPSLLPDLSETPG